MWLLLRTMMWRRKKSYFPLYWLVKKEPCDGLLTSPHNWVGFYPLYIFHNQYFFHCSPTRPVTRLLEDKGAGHSSAAQVHHQMCMQHPWRFACHAGCQEGTLETAGKVLVGSAPYCKPPQNEIHPNIRRSGPPSVQARILVSSAASLRASLKESWELLRIQAYLPSLLSWCGSRPLSCT